MVAIPSAAALVYGLHPYTAIGAEPPLADMAMYEALNKPVWAMAVSWVIVTCASGRARKLHIVLFFLRDGLRFSTIRVYLHRPHKLASSKQILGTSEQADIWYLPDAHRDNPVVLLLTGSPNSLLNSNFLLHLPRLVINFKPQWIVFRRQHYFTAVVVSSIGGGYLMWIALEAPVYNILHTLYRSNNALSRPRPTSQNYDEMGQAKS